MFDLLAFAERCRFKAAQYELSAKKTTSSPFAKCYRELAQLLVLTADINEDFLRHEFPMKQQANDHLISRAASKPRRSK
jgi:hypothetical protein